MHLHCHTSTPAFFEIHSLAESFDFMARTLKIHISKLNTTETTLIQQQQLLKTILDATPDFVSLQDSDLTYRAVNKAFCELVRKQEKQIIGKTDNDLFSPQWIKINRQEDLTIVESGKRLIKESEVTGSDGKRWLHVVKLPVLDSDGKVVFAGKSSMLGKVVVVSHSHKMHTVYAGLSKIAPTIHVGSKIKKGYVVGKVSEKLIFQATKNSKHINPLKLIKI